MNSTISYETPDPEAVQAADPLGADELCPVVVKMNSEADTAALTETMWRIAPSLEDVERFGTVDRLAAMRDVGTFLGSLKRHGVEPVEACPQIEPILLRLGELTDMVPRETLHHYVVWNPVDERRRRFTDDPMEDGLIDSVRITLPGMIASIDLCGRLHDMDLADPQAARAIWELAEHARGYEASMDLVAGRTTPEFFAKSLRPYFEDIVVNGEVCAGQVVAHAPWALLDLALWSSDDVDAADYEEFWRPTARYAVPAYRRLYDDWSRRPSLVARATRAVEEGDDSPDLRDSLAGLAAVLRALVVFRGKHLRIAGNAYAVFAKLNNRGNHFHILKNILDLTRQNSELVRGRAHQSA